MQYCNYYSVLYLLNRTVPTEQYCINCELLYGKYTTILINNALLITVLNSNILDSIKLDNAASSIHAVQYFIAQCCILYV